MKKSCCQEKNNYFIVMVAALLWTAIIMGIVGCGGGGSGYEPSVVTSTATMTPTGTRTPTVTSTPTGNSTKTPTPTNTPGVTATPTADPNSEPSDPNDIDTYPAPASGHFSSKVTTSKLTGGQEVRVGDVDFSFTNVSTDKKYSYATDSDGVAAVLNLPCGEYKVSCPDFDQSRTVNFDESRIYITNFRDNLP